jgi:mannan endo-1,4-beta-mannosidase
MATRLVETLCRANGEIPRLLGGDYEHDRIFTPTELGVHCHHHGALEGRRPRYHKLVAAQPARERREDIATRAARGRTLETARRDECRDTSNLLDTSTKAGAAWRRKLGRVATRFASSGRGVVVLWRPLQEMKGFCFWWGTMGREAGDANAR